MISKSNTAIVSDARSILRKGLKLLHRSAKPHTLPTLQKYPKPYKDTLDMEEIRSS